MSRKQRTFQRSATRSGSGLFTGTEVQIRIAPAPCGHGIVFRRVDMPGQPAIPAQLDTVKPASRCTMLCRGEASVQTVEHLLAALRAYEIDNVLIEIDGPEVPIFDGSAKPFVAMIEEGGIQEQEENKKIYTLKQPISWSKDEIHLVALPSHEYRISYTLHYPHSALLGSQFYSFVLNQDQFKNDIAPCRTFSLYEEIAPLIEKGLIKGGDLNNAVLIKEDRVVNPEGVRFPDEMVRHKVLDLVGDLSLIPTFVAHVIAIRSGHSSNNAFAKELIKTMENA